MLIDNGTNKFDQTLLILGVHLSSSGYPNVKYRIEEFKRFYPECNEINFPMWKEKDMGDYKRYSFVRGVVRALCAHVLVIISLLFSKKNKVVYIPYPSVFICFAISLLPSLLKPKRLVIDAFISIYDSVVIDRKLVKPEHVIAKLLKFIERRAFNIADVVITDTELNSIYYSDLFGLHISKFENVWLSTDEQCLNNINRSKKSFEVEVLFVGTLVPLHGIDTILEAIDQTANRDTIHYTIVGDGQNRESLESYSEKHPERITWVKEWQNEEQIAEYISNADICLGIFGGGQKAQRVCPLKLYLYMSSGKAIITSDTAWVRSATAPGSDSPFLIVPAENSISLANMIVYLAKNVEKRKQLESSSRDFYCKNMTNERSTRKCIDLLGLTVD